MRLASGIVNVRYPHTLASRKILTPLLTRLFPHYTLCQTPHSRHVNLLYRRENPMIEKKQPTPTTETNCYNGYLLIYS